MENRVKEIAILTSGFGADEVPIGGAGGLLMENLDFILMEDSSGVLLREED